MKTILFAEQGYQYAGMSEEVLNDVEADDLLSHPIKELYFDKPYNGLGNTTYAQPALCVVKALSLILEKERHRAAQEVRS